MIWIRMVRWISSPMIHFEQLLYFMEAVHQQEITIYQKISVIVTVSGSQELMDIKK